VLSMSVIVVVIVVTSLDQELLSLCLLGDGRDDGRPGVVVGELVCLDEKEEGVLVMREREGER